MEEVTERSWRDLHPLIVKVAQFDMTVANDDAKSLAPLAQVVATLKQVATDNGLSAQPRLKDLASLKPELLSTRPGGVAGLAIEAGPVFGTSSNTSFDAMALPPGTVAPQGMGGFPVQIPSLTATPADPFSARSSSVSSFHSTPAPASGFNGEITKFGNLSIQPTAPPTFDDIYGASGPSSTRSAPPSGNFNGFPPVGQSLSVTPTNSSQWNVRSNSFNDTDNASAYSGYSMPSSGPPPPPSMPPPPPPPMPMTSNGYGAAPAHYGAMVPNTNTSAPSPWAQSYTQPPPPPGPPPMSMYGSAPPRQQAPPPPQPNPNYNPFGF